jgi:RHS repeat-associated protein
MVTYTNGNGAQIQWIYNLRNLPTTITYPGPLNVVRGYDNAGRWTSVQDWNSNTTTFGYDADSNLTSETFPAASGVVDSFTFNAADQMTGATSSKSGSNITPFPSTYTRDSANQLTSDTSAASGTGSYKYTLLNQLCYAGSSSTNACTSPPTGSISYTYDAADNLTKKGTVFQAFNNSDELCWTASSSAACASPPSGKTTYQYDTRGNRTGVTPSVGQAQTLTYDQANRLTTYAAASTTSYGYNGDGLRMCKVAGSSTQSCQAIGASQFLWDVATPLPLLVKDGTIAYVYGPGGLPLEQINGSTTLWYHHDQIGSTRLITDSTGTSQATYTYDPYGGLASSTGTVTNPFRFAAQYQDPSATESGFYYLRTRFYDLATGQFITVDPVLKTTRQGYSYAKQTPLNASDPSGLCAGWDLGCYANSAWHAASNQVDYISLSGTVSLGPLPVGVTFGLTYTRTGHLYGTVGGGVMSPGGSADLRAGHIFGAHKPSDVDSYVKEWSVTAAGMWPLFPDPEVPIGVGPSGGVTWGYPFQRTDPGAFSGEGGVGAGTPSGSVCGTYSWQIPGIQGPSW